ncbi:MAG: hypothetical protein IPM52_05410 [Bacteroidetes bacterium]|nr:hypothetical protein [Bacteroidota bacterium]
MRIWRLPVYSIRILLWLIVFFVSGQSYLHAGWLIVEQKSDRFGNFGMQSTMISGNKVRIEHQTSSFIFDLDSNQITVILPRRKIYWKGNHDTLGSALFHHLDLQIGMMIAQMPEKEREKASVEMQSLMALMRSSRPDSLLPEHFRIVSADSTKRIGEYLCHKYLFMVDTMLLEEIWVTREIQPWQGIDLKRLNQMMRLFSKPNLYTAYRVSDEWLSMLSGGMLVRSVAPNSLGGSVVEVSMVRQTGMRGEVFLPPADYRRAGVEEMLNVLMGGADAIKQEDEAPGLPKLPARPRQGLPKSPP